MEPEEIADKLKEKDGIKDLVNPDIQVHDLEFEGDETDKYLGIVESIDKKTYYNILVDKGNVHIEKLKESKGKKMYKEHKDSVCSTVLCYVKKIDTSSGWSMCQ